MFFRKKRKKDSAGPGEGYTAIDGEWASRIWDRRPIRVPAVLDVEEFLQQRPMPSPWPDDDEFNADVGGDEETLRHLWLIALLGHPNPAVVAQGLPSPRLEGVHANHVVDLLVDPRVAQEAAEAVWRFGDDGSVRFVLNILLSRGVVPSDFTEAQSDRAVELLRSTCPPPRRAFLEAEIRGEDHEQAPAQPGHSAEAELLGEDHEQIAVHLVPLVEGELRQYGSLSERQRELFHDAAYLDRLAHRGGAAPRPLAGIMEIRTIGHRLNAEGGIRLMQRVARRAGDLSPRRTVERQLNAMWNRIGDWQS